MNRRRRRRPSFLFPHSSIHSWAFVFVCFFTGKNVNFFHSALVYNMWDDEWMSDWMPKKVKEMYFVMMLVMRSVIKGRRESTGWWWLPKWRYILTGTAQQPPPLRAKQFTRAAAASVLPLGDDFMVFTWRRRRRMSSSVDSTRDEVQWGWVGERGRGKFLPFASGCFSCFVFLFYILWMEKVAESVVSPFSWVSCGTDWWCRQENKGWFHLIKNVNRVFVY